MPPEINTMTMTACTDAGRVDIGALYFRGAEEVRSGGSDTPRVVCAMARTREGVMREGTVRKTNGRERKFTKCPFDNQVTLVVMCQGQVCANPVNVKVFRNGRLQMTGVRSEEQARVVCEHVARLMSPRVCVSGYAVHLINAKDSIGRPVDQNCLHRALAAEGVACYFDPSIYNGVKVYYMYAGMGSGKCPRWSSGMGDETVCRCGGCTRVTLLVFAKGTFIITGAKTATQVYTAALWLRDKCCALMGFAS
jgi:TATA-box binding protein (TBP) (component of TFIID and TFIIIB)